MHELAVDCRVGAPGFSEEFHDMARCNSDIPSFNFDDEAGCSCHRLWKRPRALMPKETFAHRKTEHLETCAQIVRLWIKNSRFRHSSANRQDVERLNRAIEYLQNRMQQKEERGGDPRSDPARPGRQDSEAPPSLAAAGTGDRLGGRGRVVCAGRPRPLLAPKAYHRWYRRRAACGVGFGHASRFNLDSEGSTSRRRR